MLGGASPTALQCFLLNLTAFDSTVVRMRVAIPPLHAAMEELLAVVDKDTEAFSQYMVNIRIGLETSDCPLHPPGSHEAAQEYLGGEGGEGGRHAAGTQGCREYSLDSQSRNTILQEGNSCKKR